MAKVEITSNASGGGSVATGVLQLLGGVAMSATLVSVTDQSNTASQLLLSTTATKVAGTLQITTNNTIYLDIEDGSGNNRFTIGRDPSLQVVNVDFASNPTGSTDIVGAIRTYQDGVNLAAAMQFREDGDIFGSGTQTTSNFVIQKESTNDLIIYSPSTWGGLLTPPTTGSSNTMLNGSLTGSHGGFGNVAVGLGVVQADGSAYNFNIAMGQAAFVRGRFCTAIGQGATIGGVSSALDYATALGYGAIANANNSFALGDSTAKLQIGGNFTPTARIHSRGLGATSATTSLLLQNSASTNLLRVTDDGNVSLNTISNLDGSGIVKMPVYLQSQSSGFVFKNSGSSDLLSLTASLANFLGTIAFNNASPSASACVDLTSTTKGFLPPRMTDAQRAAIATPAEGLILFNTDNKGVAYRDGTNWGYLSGALQNATGSGGTLAISFASGNIVNLTLNASTTLTFAGHVVGTYIIEVTQGGAGSNTLTYPASVKWSGGTAPTLTTAVGKTDILTFYHDGTSFFGTYSLNY
jgi:hypothetical protein